MGARSRIKTLEQQVREMKSNIAQLMEKSENDNQLVSMLRRKLEASNNPYYGKNVAYQQGGVGGGGNNAVYNDGMGGYTDPNDNNVTVNNAPYGGNSSSHNNTNIGNTNSGSSAVTRGGSSSGTKKSNKPRNINELDDPDQVVENTKQKNKMMEMKKNLKSKSIYDDSYFEDKTFNAFGPNSGGNNNSNSNDGNHNGGGNANGGGSGGNGGNSTAGEDARVQQEMEELRAQVKRQAAMLQMISKA